MPWNKSEKKENQQNESSIKESSRTIKSDKAADRVPNSNGINKQLP
ncbi:hypothetical protein KZ483_13690 [Paenibacillus sp. sptzw28]|nr:hypothetical protein [Paenibacillus sp. sptzw28]QYR19030.1 hypothetical protein KZ483_13690 [Paenibacillus sp. sptzw28]